MFAAVLGILWLMITRPAFRFSSFRERFGAFQ
jgi:hypothetical protein